MRVLAILTAALLAACGAKPPPIDRSGLPTPKAPPSWAPPAVQAWTLANGMEVWYLEQSQAPLISIRMVFPNGAAADPVGRAGLGAMVADMLDEGAGDRDALQIGDDLQRMATDYGASAATDGLLVSMDMLADNLDASLAILKDLLRAPTFPEAEFARRKAQHLAAALAQEADPGTARTLTLRRALYGDGYGGMPPSGVRSTLEAIDLDEVKAHYRALVQPKGVKIIVVGAVDKATTDAALDRVFGDWTGEPSVRVREKQAEAPVAAIHFIDFPGATQSAISVARRTAGTTAEDLFETRVFNWAIGGAFTSRLNLNLREDKGYTYGARSGFSRWRQGGFFALGAKVKADTTRASLDEIFMELAAVQGKRPVSKDERNQAVNGMLLGFPGRFERLAGVAGQLASVALDGYPSDWLVKWPARMAKISTADANAAAKKYATRGDFLVVVAGDKAKLWPTLADMGLPLKLHDAQGNPVVEAPAPAPADAPAAAPATK